MKNFSGITDNLDITTKKYVDDGLAEKANSSDLATVATSGSYNDLANKLTAGSNISISGNTISATVPTNYVTTDTEQTITSKKTFNGEVKFGNTENFQGYYIKRMIGSLGAGTAYNNLDSLYKDGTWYRMWRLRFPNDSSFWGKIKVTLYGGFSSFNASGVMSKSITCNFNTSNLYNNVGCYDGLGVNVEQDFRISEAIWNDTVSAWEVLIWQKNLRGNNSPVIMLECWTTNNTNYINAFNGITAQTVELTQSTSYSAQKASPTGGTKTVEWATLPVYENPLGEEIATMSDFANVVKTTGDQHILGEKTFSNPILTQVKIGDSNRIYGASDSPVVDQYLPAKDGTFAMLDDIPDISGKANLDGGNTFTGKQTLNSPASDGYSIDAAGYVKGSWLQSGVKSNYGSGTGMVCVFDGNGWIYYRTPAEIVAEAGGGGSTEVVQTTGTSTTSVMSQKATTDELAKKANLDGANEFTDGTNTFRDIDGTTQISGSQVILKAIGVMGSASLSVQTDNNNEVFGVESDSENGVIHLNKTISLNGDMGTAGQVLTSQGASAAPIWSDVTKHGYTQLTNENLNTITTPGWYHAATGNTCINRPSGIGTQTFALVVEKSSNLNIKQTVYRTSSIYTYNRYSDDGGSSWDIWYESQLVLNDTYQSFSGCKGFDDGINLINSLQTNGDPGTAGQVLTSQGSNTTPQWKSMPTYSLSGTTLTITLP